MRNKGMTEANGKNKREQISRNYIVITYDNFLLTRSLTEPSWGDEGYIKPLFLNDNPEATLLCIPRFASP